MTDQPVCPRCGTIIEYTQTGAFVAFCAHCLAFLLPEEFSAEALTQLKESK